MTIKIDKQFTTLDMVPRTKAQMKEFKEIYTDNDLLRMFTDATGESIGYVDEILYCRLSAFPGGTMETNETHYSVDMMIDTWNIIYKVHFYISQSGEIDTREVPCGPGEWMKMWQVKKFSAA